MVSNMTVDENYDEQLQQQRERIKRLKSHLYHRCFNRNHINPGRQAPREYQLPADIGIPLLDAAKANAEQIITKMVAATLLDLSTALPMDMISLQRKVRRGDAGLKFEEAFKVAGPTTIEKVVIRLGSQEMNLLTFHRLEINSKHHFMITEINRPGLAGFAGIQDPLLKLQQQQMQKQGVLLQPDLPSPAGGVFIPGMPPMLPMPGMIPGIPPPRPPQGEPPFPVPPPGPFPGSMPPMSMPGQRPPMGGMGPPLGGPPPPLPMPPPLGPPAPVVPAPNDPFARPGRGADSELDNLLQRQSAKDRFQAERGEQLLDLLTKPSAKETATLEKFRMGGTAVTEHCPNLTKEDCRRARGQFLACPRLHFRRIIHPWTDPALGNCSYLDTCRNQRNCKYVHYELDPEPDIPTGDGMGGKGNRPRVPAYLQALAEPQWIQCDVRRLDMSVLGKFGVIMADPPWAIHQDLPYGTMDDEEMLNLPIDNLQDDGVIFLWVTGRAMELGRTCLTKWGYQRVDELIWVKTNQLQRLIVTGRTGHWLNHSKEHCLVGLKGNPQLNKYVDCDVVVAEVRETSRKPDEMYSLLERLSPGTRKLEIFARQHNLQQGWVGLGNQLNGVKILDPEMKARYEARYGPVEENNANRA